MEKLLLCKTYSGETIVDLESHINDMLENQPKDEYGFPKGEFLVKIFLEKSDD